MSERADPNRAADMSRRYLAGETLAAIGGDYGLTRERVRQILRDAEVPSLGHRPWPLKPAEVEAAELYDSGVAPRDIKAKTGLTLRQIGRACKTAGVAKKPRGTFVKRADDAEVTAAVARLYQQGLGPTEIMRLVPQIKYTTHVYRYLQKAGVRPRGKPGWFRKAA